MNATRILLMRHAEKTGDQNDMHLSAEGAARAARLADYIPATFGTPQFLFATAVSKHSMRPIETLTPLADKLGTVPFTHTRQDHDTAGLATELMADQRYLGALIVVCWHHGTLPALAQELGAPHGTYPEHWDDSVFNLILDLSYIEGAVPAVTQLTQPF